MDLAPVATLLEKAADLELRVQETRARAGALLLGQGVRSAYACKRAAEALGVDARLV
jgi:hypothetical protein